MKKRRICWEPIHFQQDFMMHTSRRPQKLIIRDFQKVMEDHDFIIDQCTYSAFSIGAEISDPMTCTWRHLDDQLTLLDFQECQFLQDLVMECQLGYN